MPRTTNDAVNAILDDDKASPATNIDPFIEAATELVTDKCTTSGYSDILLELIERWLAAHMYVTAYPRTAQEAINIGPRQTFDFFTTNLGFDNTKWGQQAMRLDYAGNLALMNNAMKKNATALPAQVRNAGTKWLGTCRRRTQNGWW